MTHVIDVCLSPELIHLYDVREYHCVVVDILRATTNMVAGLHHGLDSIKPVYTIEECIELGKEGYVTAGERNGLKVEEFDLGNSPFEFIKPEFKGKKVAMTTTNGTKAIEMAKEARKILVGSFLNHGVLVDYLSEYAENILVICAGWKGKINMEDSLFAGALVESLPQFSFNNDEPGLVKKWFNESKADLRSEIKQSSHYKRLQNLHADKDMEYCITFNSCPSLVMLDNDGHLRKH